MCGLDLLNGVTDELGEFQTLLISDGGAQILNFDQTFAYEDDLRDVRNTCNPGIADQLLIESQEPLRLFRVAARRRLPFEKAAAVIQLSAAFKTT